MSHGLGESTCGRGQRLQGCGTAEGCHSWRRQGGPSPAAFRGRVVTPQHPGLSLASTEDIGLQENDRTRWWQFGNWAPEATPASDEGSVRRGLHTVETVSPEVPTHHGPWPDPSITTVGEPRFPTSLRLRVIASSAQSRGHGACWVTHQDTTLNCVLFTGQALASVSGTIKGRHGESPRGHA